MKCAGLYRIVPGAACGLLLLSGCIQDPSVAPVNTAKSNMETAAAPVVANAATLPGGVAIPSEVRQNLGINFARVEKRKVEDTLRAPGVFELLPNAQHEYRAALSGHVHVAVKQFQEVEPETLLFSLDSPDWRRIQHEAVEAEGEITMAKANLEVARARLKEAEVSAGIADRRVAELAAVQVRKAEVETEAAAIKSSLPRLRAEIDASQAALEEANEHYLSRLKTLASMTGLSVEALRKPTEEGEAAWRAIGALEVRAKEKGIVHSIEINEGAWLETGQLVVVTLNPLALRFHAEVPQSELTGLVDGMPASVVPPQGGGIDLQDAMPGKIQIALTAHPEERTISIYLMPDMVAPWAKSGVSAFLEIPHDHVVPELAIPVGALVQEGVDTIFFRRNPNDPNRALPVKADLGASDGRWVVVRSGVKEGDEVVLEGAYALKLAGGGSQAPAGYHYHADGQLHKNH